MFYKLIGIIFTIYLKIIYFNRIKLHGFIFAEGLVSIKIHNNAKLIIKGNITLRKGSQILVRENAMSLVKTKLPKSGIYVGIPVKILEER